MRLSQLRKVYSALRSCHTDVREITGSSPAHEDGDKLTVLYQVEQLETAVEVVSQLISMKMKATLAAPIKGRGLRVKDRVRLFTNKNAMNSEYGHGELGTMAHIDIDEVKIHLDKYHEDLDQWGNCFIWTCDENGDETNVGPWLRPQLEILGDCSHVFSHNNNEATLARYCTTCQETVPGDDDDNPPRWGLVDEITQEVVSKFDEDDLLGEGYRIIWRMIDATANYEMSARPTLVIASIVGALEAEGWATT